MIIQVMRGHWHPVELESTGSLRESESAPGDARALPVACMDSMDDVGAWVRHRVVQWGRASQRHTPCLGGWPTTGMAHLVLHHAPPSQPVSGSG